MDGLSGNYLMEQAIFLTLNVNLTSSKQGETGDSVGRRRGKRWQGQGRGADTKTKAGEMQEAETTANAKTKGEETQDAEQRNTPWGYRRYWVWRRQRGGGASQTQQREQHRGGGDRRRAWIRLDPRGLTSPGGLRRLGSREPGHASGRRRRGGRAVAGVVVWPCCHAITPIRVTEREGGEALR